MAVLDFPASPSLNDEYSANGSTWKWNGTSWNIVSVSPAITVSGVGISNPAAGEVLKYDGTQWVNEEIGGLFNTTATVQGSDGTSDWTQATGADPWIATLTVSGILSTDRPIVDIDLSSVAFANVQAVQTGWSLVYRVEASADNQIKLYATAEPAPSFDLLITGVR